MAAFGYAYRHARPHLQQQEHGERAELLEGLERREAHDGDLQIDSSQIKSKQIKSHQSYQIKANVLALAHGTWRPLGSPHNNLLHWCSPVTETQYRIREC